MLDRWVTIVLNLEDKEILYFYGCIPCKVRSIVVESLLEGLKLCREPIDFDDSYSLVDINRIASILRGIVPKYTKEKLICYTKP